MLVQCGVVCDRSMKGSRGAVGLAVRTMLDGNEKPAGMLVGSC